jgi:hypothetical protein
MQKNTSFGYIFYLLSIVLGITVCIAAGIHLFLSLTAAIVKHHIYYFNPIRILGLSSIWPRYQNSDIATLITWGILITMYFALVVFYIRRYDPTLISRLNKNLSYNKQTKRLIYETRNATEIEVIPITKLITQLYKLKDLLYRVDA